MITASSACHPTINIDNKTFTEHGQGGIGGTLAVTISITANNPGNRMTLSSRNRIFLLTLLVSGSLAIYLARDRFDVSAMELWVAENPLSAPVLFILLYVLLVTLLFPSTLVSLTGGVLFGPVWGTLYVQLGAILSAALEFVLARYLLADWVESRLNAELRKLKTGVENRGWRFVLLLRILPGLPFALLNYTLGLTRIRLLHFLVVTFLCILPRVIFFTYAGDTGRRAVEGQDISVQTLIIVALLAITIAAHFALRRLRHPSL